MWHHTRKALTLFVMLTIGGISAAQQPTSTPVQVRIASITPVPDVATATPTPAANIPAPVQTNNRILLEPLSEVNVRSSPEITEDNRIGAIRAGERYVVLGVYFNWYQFQYDQVPSGRGWVYRDLVQIIQGDETAIPVIELNATPTEDTLIAAASQTQAAILEAPGGALTITAQSRIIQLPEGTVAAEGQSQMIAPDQATVLPTFTYPPNVSLRPTDTAIPGNMTENATTGGSNRPSAPTSFPPLFAILGLGALGILGLAVTLTRG
jgi:hypothetical protein